MNGGMLCRAHVLQPAVDFCPICYIIVLELALVKLGVWFHETHGPPNHVVVFEECPDWFCQSARDDLMTPPVTTTHKL